MMLAISPVRPRPALSNLHTTNPAAIPAAGGRSSRVATPPTPNSRNRDQYEISPMLEPATRPIAHPGAPYSFPNTAMSVSDATDVTMLAPRASRSRPDAHNR